MADFRIVILSRNAANLVPCVQAIFKHEPDLPHERIVVVDDGARALAESKLAGITWLDGMKPFIFSRNANIGMLTPVEGAYQDAILLNDDAELETPGGFTALSLASQQHPEFGIIAASCNNVGNRNQLPRGRGLRTDPRMVCFICVYIPLTVLKIVGPLDERFGLGYGSEDDDMCKRIRLAGFTIGIFDDCFVDHSKLQSTYRSKGHADITPNKRIYLDKWGTFD